MRLLLWIMLAALGPVVLGCHLYARGDDDTLIEAVKPINGGAWAVSPVAAVGMPAVIVAGSPSAVVDPSSNDIIVVTRTPSGDLSRLTRDPQSGWAFQSIGRPGGTPPSEGTVGLTSSPLVVPGGCSPAPRRMACGSTPGTTVGRGRPA